MSLPQQGFWGALLALWEQDQEARHRVESQLHHRFIHLAETEHCVLKSV